MAGVQGMGNPSDIQPANPPPQVAPAAIPSQPVEQQVQPTQPPQQQDGINYDAMADQIIKNHVKKDGSYDYDGIAEELIKMQKGQSSFGDRLLNDVKDVGSSALSFLDKTAQVIEAPIAGAANELATSVSEHPLSIVNTPSIIAKGAVKGALSPLSQPSIKDSADKLGFDKINADVYAPNIPVQSDPYGEMNDMGMPKQDLLAGKPPVKLGNVTASQAIDVAASMMAPEVMLKGASKAPEVAKFIGKGISPIYDTLKAARPSKIEEAVNAADSVVKNINNVEEAAKKFDITLNHVMKDPANPEAVDVARALKKHPVYQNIEEEIGNQTVNAIKNIPKTFANISEDAATTDEVLSTLKGAKKSSGKQIENLKNKAIEAFGNGKIPAPEFQKAIDSALDSLTTSVEENKLYISDPKKEQELTNYLQSLSDKVFNSQGKMTFGEWEKEYQALTKKSRQAFDKNTSPVYENLRKSLSRDQDGMMAVGLQGVDDAAAKAFKEGKQQYSTVMQSYDRLGSLLDKNELVADSLIKRLFFSEAKSADDAKAVFDVLAIEKPKMVQDLRGKAWNYLVNEAKMAPSPEFPFGIDFKKMSKQIRDMGGSDLKSSNLLDIMTGSKDDSKKLMEFADVLESVQNGYMGRGQKTINELQFGRALNTAASIKTGNPMGFIQPIIDSMKESKNLRTAFENMDVQKVIQGFPPAKRAEAEKLLRKVLKK